MSEATLNALRFKVSTFSGGGNCVEIGLNPNGGAVIRDTKDPARVTALAFGRDEWTAFIDGVKNDEFSRR
jgi:hypothetical protein